MYTYCVFLFKRISLKNISNIYKEENNVIFLKGLKCYQAVL
jgi:hypothetical protein